MTPVFFFPALGSENIDEGGRVRERENRETCLT